MTGITSTEEDLSLAADQFRTGPNLMPWECSGLVQWLFFSHYAEQRSTETAVRIACLRRNQGRCKAPRSRRMVRVEPPWRSLPFRQSRTWRG